MPSFEERTIFRQVKYIKNKFKGVREETESVLLLLQSCLEIFDRRIEELIQCNKKNFTSFYRKLNNEFEDFQEKLMFIQASVELPSDCQLLSQKVSIEKLTELQSTDKPSSLSLSSSIQEPPLLSSASKENVLASFNEDISDNSLKTKSLLSSKSTSYTSVNDFEDAVTDYPSVEFSDNKITFAEEELLPNVQATSSTASYPVSTENVVASYQDSSINSQNEVPSKSFSSLSNHNLNSIKLCSELDTDTKSLKKTEINHSLRQNVKSEINQIVQSFGSINSIESLSQGSCYRSISSGLSDVCYQSVSSKQGTILSDNLNTFSSQSEPSVSTSQTCCEKNIIDSLQIDLPLITAATITHIENPGNFWMVLDKFENSMLYFPKEKFFKSDFPSAIENGDFFLAPSKSVPIYLRVKVIAVQRSDERVNVFFIDHGSTQNIKKQELRYLPQDVYDIPAQAINCSLANISARNGIWCFAAIQKLKDLSSNSIEAHIKNQTCEKYSVQLTATVSMFNDQFPCDIGQSLCYDGYAEENEPPFEIIDRNSAPALCDKNLINSTDMSNQLNHDSGVSVNSNQPPTPTDQTHHYSSNDLNSQVVEEPACFRNELQEICCEKLVFKEQVPIDKAENKIVDLISFESDNELQKQVLQSEQNIASYNKCLKICTCKCPLHCIIPFPTITFVEDHMVLVMLSYIVNPNEFYVNMAMESVLTLDELQEQMTNAYNSQASLDTYSILLEDLKEGMFCATWFDDGNWYRAKVLDINRNFDESKNVLVQYIDYGNNSWVNNTDLKTLAPEFVEPPAFSVKCSLAGVVPCQLQSLESNCSNLWSKESVEVFKSLIGFENCLTAQICDRTSILSEDPLQILLWDTHGEKDVLINEALVGTGLAQLDTASLEKLLVQSSKIKPEIEVLSFWDPMADEFNDVQNSYGVNFDDFQVAFDGYKYNDEEYVCKYYSLRGHCPRLNCKYKHVPLAEGGVTRDQDELYSFDSHPPLPPDGSFILIQVCSVINPNFFYAQLPFGNLTVDELDSLINRGTLRENLQNQEVNALYDALNKHYTNKPFDERTTVALSYGSIVVAKRQYDQTWHRARVLDVEDVTGPAKVFFVDFGNEEWVNRKNIRQILPEFLHTPFQAVECCLSDVEPLGLEKGFKWSIHAVDFFKNLVSETVMLARLDYKCNNILQVSLRRTTQNDHLTVREHLIREGLGQEKSVVVSKKPVSKYIPG